MIFILKVTLLAVEEIAPPATFNPFGSVAGGEIVTLPVNPPVRLIFAVAPTLLGAGPVTVDWSKEIEKSG